MSVCAEGLSARAAGWQPRVVLADQPLARGLHYWRLRIDHYDGDADPAFGIARADVAKDKMLGNCYVFLLSLCFYIVILYIIKNYTSVGPLSHLMLS